MQGRKGLIPNVRSTSKAEGSDTRETILADKQNAHKIVCIPINHGYGDHLSIWEKIARIIYRIVEFAFSATVLLLTIPIMVIIGIIIKLDTPGPALFFQDRCSRSKKVRGADIQSDVRYQICDPDFSPDKEYWVPTTFRFVKFRTMYVDARKRFPELYDYNYTKEEIETIAFKYQNDPRVSKIGEWFRKSTLDELPNFWNVLKGDMRLVGPRPEVYEMIHNYRPEQMKKFTVKPGITGLSQIRGRGRLGCHFRIQFHAIWNIRIVSPSGLI
ncbi:MAG: glucosyl-1-phosphate transferase [Candidatus Scalindua brodae]|uniref:Glucosyl-1-phosphate transferase n=1 Tax=Candidatus Scalindua brodae TaxID=237368 RepID=A0A0B0EJU3_9BACT|nr:MAG: glucosyl-1-phosphate transferase [Candidatus Scalindua brodae]